MKKTVYLSLGSNLGQRVDHLQAALDRLHELGQVTAVSSIYETEPVDVSAQPWFLNCVVALETELMPKQFLARTHQIEQQLGRRRSALAAGIRAGFAESRVRKAPRPIDIDILLFGHSIVDTPTLTIPHPGMHERRFVLEPLTEIAPDARHPVFKISARQMRDAAARQKQTVKRVDHLLVAKAPELRSTE